MNAMCSTANNSLALAAWLGLLCASAQLHGQPAADAEPKVPTASVGRAGTIEQLVLPGSELEVRTDLPGDAPLVLRIKAVFPHGTAHRYDLVFYGLDPGRYDLKEYLKRVDGTAMDDVPAIPVDVRPLLPAGQFEPHALTQGPLPRLGGYRLLLIASGVVWLAALLVILLAGRRKRLEALAAARPVTLADQLRPLVTAALAGTLSEGRRAELERLLLTYWRRRRRLEGIDAAAAMARLREDDEAGPLVRQLEAWLHAPERSGEVDVAALLRPYQDLPAEEPPPEVVAEPALAARGGP